MKREDECYRRDGMRALRGFLDELHKGTCIDAISNWPELADALVENSSRDGIGIYLAYLHGRAWRQVLPAWMMAAARSTEPARIEEFVVPIIGTIDAETSKGGGDEPTAYHERVDGLTDDQRAALGDFVAWIGTLAIMSDPRSAELKKRLLLAWPAR